MVPLTLTASGLRIAMQQQPPMLPPQVQAFVNEYLSNGRNGAAAYLHAYPGKCPNRDVAAVKASQLKATVRVRRALEFVDRAAERAVSRVIDRYVLGREQLAERLCHFAFTDIDQLVELVPVLDQAGNLIDRKVMVRDMEAIPSQARAAIHKLVQSDKGRLSVELPDRRACIMDIARLKGWIVDKPIETPALVTLKIER